MLARIDVEAYGYRNARTAAIATANELATPERPLYVRFDWWVGDEATSDVVHIAPAVPRLAFPAEDARLWDRPMNEMLEEAIAPFERGDRKLASKAMGEFAKKIVAKGRPRCRVARSVAVL